MMMMMMTTQNTFIIFFISNWEVLNDLIRKKGNINQSDTLHIQPFFSTPAHKKVKNFSPFDVLLSRNVSYLFPCKFINTTHQLARGIELI